MAVAAPVRRTTPASRRIGYVAAVVVNLVILYLLHVAPGWQDLPFLTADTALVLGWVDASLVTGVVANLVYVVHDAPVVHALGDVVTTGVGLVAIVRVWQVFPFAFDDAGVPWEQVARVVLVVAVVGSAIAIIVQLVTLVRALAGKDSRS
jgi:hypothetical protein